MEVNKVKSYAALGGCLKDKLVLALVGLMAPRQDMSGKRWWRLFDQIVPGVWLKPKKLNGLRLLIKPADWSQTIIFEEIFLQMNYDLDKVTFTPEVIFDCGAHIGMFSLLAKSKFPGARIIAYEPNPQNAAIIRSQIARNGLDVTLVESALSTEKKELGFVWSNSHSGKLLHDDANAHICKVSVVNFIEIVKELHPSSLLLKMDIEGEESVVMLELVPLMPKRSALFFETHSGEPGWNEMQALLTGNGFQVKKINARGQFYDGFACRG